MREHPILFSAPMVNALLADRKSVTRRLSKQWLKVKAGDRLWVRETWQVLNCEELPMLPLHPSLWDYWQRRVRYRSTDGDYDVVNPKTWKPSIHMPRWASRILLECEEDARPERLHDITEAEAIAEGIDVGSRASDPEASPNICVNCGQHRKQHVGVAQVCFGSCGELFSTRTFRGGFAFLWSTIHTKPGERWEDNPEVVRAGRFRRIE